MKWIKVPKVSPFLCVPVLLWSLGGCSDRRPGVDQAKKDFLVSYPQVKIENVEVTGDEVIARYFKVEYRVAASDVLRTLNFQYLKTDSGNFEINPKLK